MMMTVRLTLKKGDYGISLEKELGCIRKKLEYVFRLRWKQFKSLWKNRMLCWSLCHISRSGKLILVKLLFTTVVPRLSAVCLSANFTLDCICPPPPWTPREAPYCRSSSVVESQISGVKWSNVILCRDPLQVHSRCIPECLRVLAHSSLLLMLKRDFNRPRKDTKLSRRLHLIAGRVH